MKMKRKIFILILLSFLAACESSTENNNEQALLEEPLVTTQTEETLEETYELRYHLAHADRIRSISYLAGEEIILFNANRDGYSFGGWYLDEDLTIPLESITMPNKDLDLYPKWNLSISSLDETESDTASVVYVTTPREELESSDVCRINKMNEEFSITVGFPVDQYRLNNLGVLHSSVIFIDFPEYPGTMSKQELDSFYLSYIEGINDFYNTQSYGRLTFTADVYDDFIRFDDSFYNYSFLRDQHDMDAVLRRSIELSDPLIDYGNTDYIVAFLNPEIPESLAPTSPAWPLHPPWGIETDEKTIFNATFIGGDGARIGWGTVAHEMGHLFGLMDLSYDWNPEPGVDPAIDNAWLNQFIFVGAYDLMGFGSGEHYGDNRELFIWNKYLLEWVLDSQVRCLDASKSSETNHLLTDNHIANDDEKAVFIRLSEHQVLVIESKDKNQYCEICNNGLFAYVVDSTLNNGHGPIRLIRPEGSSMQMFEDAYLREGETLTYENITITFVDRIENQSFVSVSIKNQ
jgi:M6 family metalloprotease-like protein/uncharacterized repeat protein (TIGR02543 family)